MMIEQLQRRGRAHQDKQRGLGGTRRSFLRGCGAAMALPWLESLRGSARGASPQSPPVRLAFFYIPNGVVQSAWRPASNDRGLALRSTLQPLENVKEKISLLTNLDRIKVAGTDGHAQASTCWLSSAAPDELSPAGYPLNTTIDQLVAAESGRQTAFRSLELSCNPYEDNRESVYFDNISWYGHGHVARSQRDPSEVFRRLFVVDDHQFYASVLDLVQEDAKSLHRSLSVGDRHKLGEYLESVRTVERQIDRVKARQAEFRKMEVKAPVKIWQAMTREEFIQVMGDLMVLALQTDLTRVATLMTGPERWATPLMVHGLFEKPVQHHGWTHSQNDKNVREKLQRLDQFHVEQFAKLVAKMDAIQEGEGTLLDNMIFTLGSGLSSGELHVCTNLPTVIAGSAGKRMPTNRHLAAAPGTPIANLWLSLCQIMGLKRTRVGDSTEPLRGLLA